MDECERAWIDWRSQVSSYRSQMKNSATPTVWTATSTIYGRSMPCSSRTCSVCYAVPKIGAIYHTTIPRTQYGDDDPLVNKLKFPKPRCDLSPESCERLQADFRISDYAYTQSVVGRLSQAPPVVSPVRVPCENLCQIVATHKASLFYFAGAVTMTKTHQKNLCTDFPSGFAGLRLGEVDLLRM